MNRHLVWSLLVCFQKAEGALQDQVAGTNGSALYGRLQFPEFINPVNLKPDAAGVTGSIR